MLHGEYNQNLTASCCWLLRGIGKLNLLHTHYTATVESFSFSFNTQVLILPYYLSTSGARAAHIPTDNHTP